jgi:4-hydroxy-3-polyprenylbenzoate decarboxylase
MYPTTRDFLNALTAAGEVKRITQATSPVLEIAALADAESKLPAPHLPSKATRRTDPTFHSSGGKALYFESVQGSDWPVLINAWGSYRRMEMALGCQDVGGHTPGGLEALAARIGSLVKPQPPSSLREVLAKAREFVPLLKIPPKRKRGSGLCQEVVVPQDRIDLTRLPIIKCWPLDGDFATLGYPARVNDGIEGLGSGADWDANFRGRYITLAGIHTVHADDRDHPKPASHNIGMYRVQLLGKRRMAMHWHMHHDGARHWRSWKKLGKPMPVAIALGGESVMPYAATAPLPPGISELLLAGFLNRGGIPLVRGKTVPLWVPANAEIVIEGYVSHEAGFINWDPRDAGAGAIGPGAVFEGPFGDHTGFYSLPDRYPILDVTCITHRRDPIYPTTVVGLPPQEDYFLGKTTERVFLPLLKTLIHDIEDYDLPIFGAFHNCATVQIKKAYPLQGRRVMHSVWGAGQMAWTKSIFVVDDNVDVHDAMAVLRAAADNCHPLRDVETVNGPLDILDHAAPRLGAGMKIGFDCTRKIAGEEVNGVPVLGTPTLRVGSALGTDTLRVASASESDTNMEAALAALGAIRALPRVLSAKVAPEGSTGWLLVRIRKDAPRQGRETLAAVFDTLGAMHQPQTVAPFVLVVPQESRAESIDDQLFHWLAHSDASRDMHRWVSDDGSVHRLGFDATRKMAGDECNGQAVREWPPLLMR